MKTCIVVPVKDFQAAKQRLSSVLSNNDREDLARWLCQRTLMFFREHFSSHHLLVVTASDDVARMAVLHGAEVLRERDSGGLSAAVQIASDWVRDKGFTSMLVMPADIACLDKAEVQTLLAHPREETSVILCPARDGGTNALLCTPPDAIPFHFGKNSSEAHDAAAKRAGVPCHWLPLQHLGLDLDTSDDLWALPLPASCFAPQIQSLP